MDRVRLAYAFTSLSRLLFHYVNIERKCRAMYQPSWIYMDVWICLYLSKCARKCDCISHKTAQGNVPYFVQQYQMSDNAGVGNVDTLGNMTLITLLSPVQLAIPLAPAAATPARFAHNHRYYSNRP